MRLIRIIAMSTAIAAVQTVLAQPMFDTGRVEVQGVQLLQNFKDPNTYYYIPTSPRIATHADGALQLLCIKYVDGEGSATGGLFHALVEFTLPPAAVEALEKELQKKLPDAHVIGPVPLFAQKREDEASPGSFEIVSATLSDRGEKGLTRAVVTSGAAPLTPGSRAAVAASLSAHGATLLWSSLTAPTSDVSVAINAYYEAVVTGFNGRVTADVSTVYKHYSTVFNQQQEYSRRQIRRISDELLRNGTLKVESFDRGGSLGMKTDDMSKLLDLVTQKLTELMFDMKTGFSADPEREAGVEAGQLPGRQERSWLARTFGGTEDTKYYTDDQWVLKDRKDIRHNVFAINLTKNGTIKVPLNTAGNLGGLYREAKDDPRYFRIVNLDDAAFEKNTVAFQVDGEYVDAFADTINFVAVNLRKHYSDPTQADALASARFDASILKNGDTIRSLTFPRLGETGPTAREYEYQFVWSVRDRPSVRLPEAEGEWLRSSDAVISLVPPFQKVVVEVDSDREQFRSGNIQTCILELKYPLGGTPISVRKATLRASDAESTNRLTYYRDRDGAKTQMRVTWHYKNGTKKTNDWQAIDETYFNLVPPAPSDAGGGS